MIVSPRSVSAVWCDGQEYKLAEGGVVYLPRQIPRGYRITSKRADLLMINTPAGIEGMFREPGRDKSTPRPPAFQVQLDPAIADKYGNIILGPPRQPAEPASEYAPTHASGPVPEPRPTG